MAYTGTIITEAELAFYYGANVAAGGATADASDQWVKVAEAFLCDLVKYDIVTNWAVLNPIYKLIFTEYAGQFAAVMAISYDPNSFTTDIEAENMMVIRWGRMLEIIETLNNADVQDFIGV